MQFFRYITDFLWKAINALANPIVYVGTAIISAVTSFAVFLYKIFESGFSVFSIFFDILDKFDSYVGAFTSYLADNPLWHFFYNMFALDVCAQSLSYLISIFVVVAFLSLFGFAFASLSAITPFIIIRLLRSGVSIASGGILKP